MQFRELVTKLFVAGVRFNGIPTDGGIYDDEEADLVRERMIKGAVRLAEDFEEALNAEKYDRELHTRTDSSLVTYHDKVREV